MRHLSDVLEEGAAAPQELPEYYQAIGRKAGDLQSLVENLLDFGRIEEGRHLLRVRGTGRRGADERRREGNGRPPAALDTTCVWPRPRRGTRSGRSSGTGPGAAQPARERRQVFTGSPRRRPRGVDRRVAIAVRDYGVGVPRRAAPGLSQVRPRIGRATLMVKGTGIGLAMADRIVRAHGGTIRLESAPGRGSTFTIACHGPMPGILIVEDEPSIALALATISSARATRPSWSAMATPPHAKTATGSISSCSTSCCPKEDGFDVCRDVRRAGVTAPIVMLTARTQDTEKVLGFESGADDYVTKPYSARELRARVKAHLRRADRAHAGRRAVRGERARLRALRAAAGRAGHRALGAGIQASRGLCPQGRSRALPGAVARRCLGRART